MQLENLITISTIHSALCCLGSCYLCTAWLGVWVVASSRQTAFNNAHGAFTISRPAADVICTPLYWTAIIAGPPVCPVTYAMSIECCQESLHSLTMMDIDILAIIHTSQEAYWVWDIGLAVPAKSHQFCGIYNTLSHTCAPMFMYSNVYENIRELQFPRLWTALKPRC